MVGAHYVPNSTPVGSRFKSTEMKKKTFNLYSIKLYICGFNIYNTIVIIIQSKYLHYNHSNNIITKEFNE